MSIVQILGVGFFVAVGCLFGCCANATPNNGKKLTLFGPQMESFQAAAVAAAGNGIPYVGVNFLPLIRKALETEPNWRQELAQAIANETRFAFAESDVQQIEDEFSELTARFDELQHFESNDKKSKTLTAEIESILLRMIGRLFKGDSLFRLYPSLSLPALVDFTSFAVAIKSKLQKYVPNSKVFCKLQQTFDIYLEPTYLERFRKIEHCVTQGTDKRNKGFSLLGNNEIKNNIFNSNGESYIGCKYDNFARIRNRMQEFFKNVSSPIAAMCIRDKSYEQMLEKTGYGWLRIDIGAVRAVGLYRQFCDNFAFVVDGKYCDPYLKIFIDSIEVYTTKKLLNAIGWQSFDEVFNSPRISHNSIIKFQLFDDDGKENYGDPLLLEKEMPISGTENVNQLNEGRSIVLLNIFWRDEFKDEI